MSEVKNFPIYLDYHSTTPVDPRVAEKVLYAMTGAFGNANSVDHAYGDEAAEAVKKARQQVAALIQASPKEVIFTSGATESINLVIQGYGIGQKQGSRILVSPVEHKAVLDCCEAMVKRGLTEIVWLKVNEQAQLDLEYLEQVCREGGDLLCVMAANNEVGTIYPMEKIGVIAHRHQIPWFCDASQGVGKIPIRFQDWGITYLSVSGHKFYGPKGVGALVVRKGYSLPRLMYGGGQEEGMRSGTLNVPGIVGLGEACALRQWEMMEDEKAIAQKRDKLQNLLLTHLPQLIINGDLNHRLAGNLHLSLPPIPNSAIMARVRHQLAISTGAACSSGTPTPSHVLQGMKLPQKQIDSALRISVGKFTTEAEIEAAAALLIQGVRQLATLMD
ncbi:cysteine desulfurase [Spirulina subsalsa FACHB-351]|uniref:Cysteine desulfurase n=1 Tax=Spirulina subsalsa FACHB-351 TaxID=234711 RepID=A0ABT3LC94_9CYAN|nr:cysteine desulfurase family protein [Spirulina subsalsa]MCW6038724.1 cysteine desulfurase [Spirulina subsalsa FACHB-351]